MFRVLVTNLRVGSLAPYFHILSFGLGGCESVTRRSNMANVGGMRVPFRAEDDLFDIHHLESTNPMAQFGEWFTQASETPGKLMTSKLGAESPKFIVNS